MSKAQPTRRTLVKGAAWSVPVVAMAHGAPAYAVSPGSVCNIEILVTCDANSDLIFTWKRISGVVPSELTFTYTVTRDNQGNDGTVYPIASATISGNTVSVPSDQSGIVRVDRDSNAGLRTYTVTAGGGCTGTSKCGSFQGNTCRAFC